MTHNHRRPFPLPAATLACLLWFSAAPALAQMASPPGHTEISLLTFSPGSELYATFGHTAFRVRDPDHRIDYVFNYGTFDFNTPDFYLNFVRGRLDYVLSVNTFADELEFQRQAGRQVRELVLDLTPPEAQALAQALFLNAQPENRAYRYDFLMDNCATRPRDLLERVLGARVSWPGTTTLSFRDRLDPYLEASPWVHWGINLVLGTPADKKTTVRESMFLPEALEAVVRASTLVKTERNLTPPPTPLVPSPWPGPGLVLWVLAALVLGLSVVEGRRGQKTRTLDLVLFTTVGLVGLVILFLWALTDHTSVRPNFNLVWAFPLGLVLAPFLWKGPRWLRWAWLAVAVQAVAGLVLMALGPWGPQRLDPTGVPLLLMMAGRALLLFWPAPQQVPTARKAHVLAK